ncbi:MAG: hypothetical protein PHG07_01395 [Lachnospiraceae bacterium]|nr:hypothetical protein [Lachnospiraceae bacterium]
MLNDNIIYRVRKFLEEKGTAESFRYIKSLDTIELVGTSKNGKERVLVHDIVREYGEGTVKNNCGYEYLIPCIPEGVIKSRTDEGVIYYTHFKATNMTSEKYDLEIKEYDFCNSNFYLRYIITIKGIVNKIGEDSYGEINVSYACIEQFLINSFSKQELNQYFSEKDMEWISKTAHNDDETLKSTVDVIIEYVLTTFQAINFLLDYKKKTNEQKCNKRLMTVINQEENYMNTNSERVIDTSKYYNLKEGKKNQKSSEKKENKIVRKTDKWIVSGHTRHYKSGKMVFVRSYYKGPNKETDKSSKTNYMVKETIVK